VIAYKFLSSGAVGLFSRHAWPTPTADAPGEWVRVEGELQPCLNGVHACDCTRLVEWIDDELWEIELADPVVEADEELVASAGRLVRRVDHWNDESALAFVSHCIDSTVALTARSLVRAGREAEADALTNARSDAGSELDLPRLARELDDERALPVRFLDDVTRLARGGRPELADPAPTIDRGGPTPATLAANLSFVCAHIAAQLGEEESAGAYDESFAAERLRQTTWLADRLRLRG